MQLRKFLKIEHHIFRNIQISREQSLRGEIAKIFKKISKYLIIHTKKCAYANFF